MIEYESVINFQNLDLLFVQHLGDLTLSSIYSHFNTLKKKAVGKTCGKR